MDIKNENLQNGSLYAFIPDILKIINKPEIDFFPFNVMYSKYKNGNNQLIAGYSVYAPDLLSLKQNNDIYTLIYYNKYSVKHWLIIEYNKNTKVYRGEKFVNGIKVFETDGSDWKGFFIHFTMLGLSNGETCEFKIIKL